jgi:phospholipid/cholesterol/gamma-HCH transport system substrate-binding protein
MESPRSIEFKVGLFVTIALILGLAFILVLGGDKAVFERKFTLHMVMDETGGLAIGSLVQVAGVQAGHVTKITFTGERNQVDVLLTLERKFQQQVTTSSVATLRTQGALGDKYVLIHAGSAAEPPLKDGDTITVEPEADLISTLGRSGSKLDKAFDIIDQVDHMMRTLNEHGFATNLGETSKHMKDTSQSLDQILLSVRGPDPKKNKIKAATDHLASILEKIDNGQGSLGGFINDPTVHEDMKTILGGAKRSKILRYLIKQTIEKGEEGEKQGAK